MTFDEWWDTTKTASTPETFAGWEHSCRQAWKAALKAAAPTVVEPEPVAWLHQHTGNLSRNESKRSEKDLRAYGWLPLYAYPPRTALTDGEIYTAYITAANQTLRPQDEKLALAFARAVIAASEGAAK